MGGGQKKIEVGGQRTPWLNSRRAPVQLVKEDGGQSRFFSVGTEVIVLKKSAIQ